ncbi:hypothetical protein ACH4E8_07065 [Streptomyces sp. NPDC017979]|uniref:hypothetical protein n=1 Tax=Streptomyces sp. NPDC017979 TaxID=3365024 RepID=UPI0037A98843
MLVIVPLLAVAPDLVLDFVLDLTPASAESVDVLGPLGAGLVWAVSNVVTSVAWKVSITSLSLKHGTTMEISGMWTNPLWWSGSQSASGLGRFPRPDVTSNTQWLRGRPRMARFDPIRQLTPTLV